MQDAGYRMQDAGQRVDRWHLIVSASAAKGNGFGFRAPKVRHISAQGNALGNGTIIRLSPEGAKS
jgi:hypothetical protein